MYNERLNLLPTPPSYIGVNDPVESVVGRCCYALEAFCEHMNGAIVGYLPIFMERMGQVVSRGNLDTQELAVSAISAASVSAGLHFTPYFPAVYNLMRDIMIQAGTPRMLFIGIVLPPPLLTLFRRGRRRAGRKALGTTSSSNGMCWLVSCCSWGFSEACGQ